MATMSSMLRSRRVALAATLGAGAFAATTFYMKCGKQNAGVAPKKKFAPGADFPDLSKHNNIMANHLTPKVTMDVSAYIHTEHIFLSTALLGSIQLSNPPSLLPSRSLLSLHSLAAFSPVFLVHL